MDEQTLRHHLHLCGEEEKQFTGVLAHLTPDEQQLFALLQANLLGTNLRLEQERIGYGWLLDALKHSTG